MKRFLLSCTGALALAFTALPASAADVRAPVYKSPPPALALFNWSGFYVGVDAGYVWTDVGVFDPAAPGAGTAVASPDSFTFGGHIGWRYQFNNALVLGVEGDLAWLDGSATGAFPGAPGASVLARTRWDGSLRGILGFAADRTLFYVTGGAAWLNANGCGVITGTTACVTGTVAATFDGWTAGFGIAHAFNNNMILRVEYLHADYGTTTFAGIPGFVGGVITVSPTTDKLRAGLSWRFGGPY